MMENAQYIRAQKRVEELKTFYRKLAVFGIIFLALTIYKALYKPDLSVNFIFYIWAIFLTIRGVKLFLLDSDWEKRKINKLLNKDNYRKK